MTKILVFLLFLSVTVWMYWSLVLQRWRSRFLFLISLFFIACFSVYYACYFLLNVAVVYIAGLLMHKHKSGKRRILQLLLLWLIGNLCLFKYGAVVHNALLKVGVRLSLPALAEFTGIVLPLGISYIIFRLIHYIVEVYRGNVPKSSFVDFALYVLFFPTFLAGPVERFQPFQSQTVGQNDIDIFDMKYGVFRIVYGMVKKFIIADSLGRFIMPVLHSPQNYLRVLVILSIYGLAIRVYMDFAGYTDIAIGVSRLFGYKIMENFNRPFFQKNVALFWRSWHISVYSWIRDYFFLPIFGYRASGIKIYLGIFVTMLVFMLWHRADLNFLVLGIYHGLGLVAWQLFQEAKRAFLGLRRLVCRKWLDPVSIFFTFSFVGFGFIFVILDMHTAVSVIQNIFS
ncbi:MBOAT family O-acyltransferase [Candidatus Omnitrophota bacterium]